MPQTILSHLLSLMNTHQAPFKVATLLTARQFSVTQAYVEQLFYRGV
jgi:hypothetical protein